MEDNPLVLSTTNIKDKIHTLRGVQVMINNDLAELYEVNTKRLNEQVKRNIDRFPNDFMFQLTQNEFENLKRQNGILSEEYLRSQIATLEKGSGKHRKYLPYAFTEEEVAILSEILRSDITLKKGGNI